MRNSEVASMLYDIADLLEMQNIQFKPAAYRKAARSVEESSSGIAEVYASYGNRGLMDSFAGIGGNIAAKIAEFLSTGKLRYYEELKANFPKHIAELMKVPGLGPKRIRALHEKLGISTLSELENAVKKQRIAAIRGFGAKSESDMLKGIELLKKGRKRMLLGYALPAALEIESFVRGMKSVKRAGIAGSIRRRKETIGDVDILASSNNPEKVIASFASMDDVSRIIAKGTTKSSVILKSGLQVDLRVVDDSSFGAALQYFTGSKEHNVAMREVAVKKGLKVNEYGVFRGEKKIAGATEEDVYHAIGMACPHPEMRENRGEVEAALKHRLPKIISYGSIRGDFHAHTKASDGSDSIEDMITAAKKLGYQYIAITDHSKSERIAHGISEEKMIEHIKLIRKAAKKAKDIAVLAGSEVDILPNGELDYSDALLKKFDIVVASVHSRFKSSREEMTKRILTALDNQFIDILSHPTGRRIGKREPYDADWGKVFDSAAQNNVYLEINAHPERTDLNDLNVIEAKRHGCKFVIATDAHSTAGLKYMHLGVSTARRAWLSSSDIVNTASAKMLPKFFKRIK